MKRTLKDHAFSFRLSAFALMILLPILMSSGARAGQEALVWGLLLFSGAVFAFLVAFS